MSIAARVAFSASSTRSLRSLTSISVAPPLRKLDNLSGYPQFENMRIIAWRTLADYIHANVGHRLHKALNTTRRAWHTNVRHAGWRNSADVKATCAHASIIGADRVVFNIAGNSYRLVAAIDFEKQIVFIKWIGTHD